VRVLDGDDVVAITATEAARTNASERKIKVFTADSEPTRNCQPTVATLQIVCFVPISSDGENGFVAFPAPHATRHEKRRSVATESCSILAFHGFFDRVTMQPPNDRAAAKVAAPTSLYCKTRYRDICSRLGGPLMPRAAERKEHPLSMRLPEADIAIIDRAAALRGRSRTDFVRDAAVRAAEDVLMEAVPIRMSAAGFGAFMKALSEPATAVPEMVELLRRAAPWEKDDSKRVT
jgi:uncharacterized protein (DUF1778 family)